MTWIQLLLHSKRISRKNTIASVWERLETESTETSSSQNTQNGENYFEVETFRRYVVSADFAKNRNWFLLPNDAFGTTPLCVVKICCPSGPTDSTLEVLSLLSTTCRVGAKKKNALLWHFFHRKLLHCTKTLSSTPRCFAFSVTCGCLCHVLLLCQVAKSLRRRPRVQANEKPTSHSLLIRESGVRTTRSGN